MIGGPGKLVAYAALTIVCAGMVAWGVVMLAFTSDDPRTITKTLPAEPLTQKSSVGDLRFDATPQTLSGAEAGPAVAQACPKVDIYELSDGAVLVCHG